MDAERLLSECGEPPVMFSEDESAGQRSSRTVGMWVGTRGVPLCEVCTLIPEKFHKKFCVFCKVVIVEGDAVDTEHSVCWHKPKFEGRVCGWCGSAKNKLHPLSNMQLVVDMVSDPSHPSHDAAKAKRFSEYTSYMQNEKVACNLRMWGSGAPKETVSADKEVAIDKLDKGMAKLLDDYVKLFGDPETSGKGHTKTKMTWKDPYYVRYDMHVRCAQHIRILGIPIIGTHPGDWLE